MSDLNQKYLIVVVGPTAIGKTSIAIQLANHFDTEIISADSRQFFKEMSIGTAKPTAIELSKAKHHFVDFLSIKDRYSAGQFEKDAISKIEELFKNKNIVIVAGGSGLYVDAITKGIDDIPNDLNIRNELNKRLEKEGIEALQQELKKLDPKHYENSAIQNPQRIIRALEVCLATGKPYSFFRNNQPKKRDFKTIKIGLTTDRDIIYDRINKRVDLMLDQGLINEVKSLEKFKDFNALNTVGYKELFQFFEEDISKEEAIDLIKKNTRNFAKRQLTWFKKDTTTKWFDISTKDDIINYLENTIAGI